jgi:hypothetical protein
LQPLADWIATLLMQTRHPAYAGGHGLRRLSICQEFIQGFSAFRHMFFIKYKE